MNRIFVFLVLISGIARGQEKAPAGFRVEGNITGAAENSVVTINDANKPTDTLARGIVKGGVFILKGQVPEPNLVILNIHSAKKKISLFIGNENVKISGNAADLNMLTISGSPSERDFQSLELTFNPYFARLNQISQLANTPATPNSRDSIGEIYHATAMAIQVQVDSFIKSKPNSYVSPFLLVVVNQLSDDVLLLEKRYQGLSPAVQESMYGKYLKELISNGKMGAVGSDAIDFTQNDTSGKPVSLASFRGQYVLIDFWASWCKPCRMENPNVVAAYQKFKDKKFTVLGVSLDQRKDAWVKAIVDDNLVWTQVSDLKFWNNAVAQQYKIQQIPQNFLIDPNGKVVGKNLRGAELDARLCALLGCN